MLNDFIILMRQELAVTVIVFLLLFLKLGKTVRNEVLFSLVSVLVLLTIGLSFVGSTQGQLFAGMFVSTPLMTIQKTLLLTAVYLILLLNYEWLRKQEHMAEFLVLLFSSSLGMMPMISSGNLLMFYLALELASIPVAAMANFDLQKKASSEAAMKMILSSAFASGILLFGISLLYGSSGTLSFGDMPGSLSGNPVEVIGFTPPEEISG